MDKKWHMTQEEFKRSWRCAADRKEQIKVLAELNCCTKKEIIDHLNEIGIAIDDELRKRSRFRIEEDRKIWRLRMSGAAFKKIASQIGRTTGETMRNRFGELAQMRADANELIERIICEYLQSDRCTTEEAAQLIELRKRGML